MTCLNPPPSWWAHGLPWRAKVGPAFEWAPVLDHCWTEWIGLPHRVGADPRTDGAACCMVMATIVLKDLGKKPPELSEWIGLANRHDWISLQLMFDEKFENTADRKPGCVALLQNGVYGLGVGTVVEGERLLFVHHYRGVATMPLNRLRLLRFAKLRE